MFDIMPDFFESSPGRNMRDGGIFDALSPKDLSLDADVDNDNMGGNSQILMNDPLNLIDS